MSALGAGLLAVPERVVDGPLARVKMLPPDPAACPVCAREHPPEQPHDATSLYWHTAREVAGEPPPTWADALAHVAEPIRSRWVRALARIGVIVESAPEAIA